MNGSCSNRILRCKPSANAPALSSSAVSGFAPISMSATLTVETCYSYPDPVAVKDSKPHADLDVSAMNVRLLEPADLAASRIWIDNWQRMLPCLTATRGLVPTSLLDVIERFVATAQPLLAIEREFSAGDPILARAAVFALLHAGRIGAPELRTTPLSWLTRFTSAEAQP
ncbi:conserved hypothetical protein [Ricinus communis]|uniref:Uncharacterized protein n=1 Tax=Ricinus communis TaxID=3988 RepID=B9T960_RICCO|nr:conserved hypothetical protein [Ricinus communis]